MGAPARPGDVLIHLRPTREWRGRALAWVLKAAWRYGGLRCIRVEEINTVSDDERAALVREVEQLREQRRVLLEAVGFTLTALELRNLDLLRIETKLRHAVAACANDQQPKG